MDWNFSECFLDLEFSNVADVASERVSLAGVDSRVDSDCRTGLRYAVSGQGKYTRDSA